MELSDNTVIYRCPDCGKILFKVDGYGSAVIVAWCKECRAEKRIPVLREK